MTVVKMCMTTICCTRSKKKNRRFTISSTFHSFSTNFTVVSPRNCVTPSRISEVILSGIPEVIPFGISKVMVTLAAFWATSFYETGIQKLVFRYDNYHNNDKKDVKD